MAQRWLSKKRCEDSCHEDEIANTHFSFISENQDFSHSLTSPDAPITLFNRSVFAIIIQREFSSENMKRSRRNLGKNIESLMILGLGF